jgi:hypothetical protein
VEELQKWMEYSTTHPELLFWLPKYLLARDRASLEQLPSFAPATANLTFSSQMKVIALGQDEIGWTHFLEGKVTGHIRPMQQQYLKTRKARIKNQWAGLDQAANHPIDQDLTHTMDSTKSYTARLSAWTPHKSPLG